MTPDVLGSTVLASSALASTTLEPGGSAGTLALLLLVLLFIAIGLLIRNMSGRLKRLPKDFAPQQDPAVPEQGRPDASR